MEYMRLQHNTVYLSGRKSIYADPFLIQKSAPKADVILITHEHYDHYSPADLKKLIGKETLLIAPQKVMEAAKRERLQIKMKTVQAGDCFETDGIGVEVVPAYNENKPYHPRSAGGVGYVLTVEGTRFYIAGDTDATAELRAVSCDVAFVPVGGVYTMDARQAAAAVNELRPRVAVPTHYGALDSVAGAEAAQQFEALLEEGIECRIF